MKYAVKLYRILKPVVIYTSYLFTLLTMLYLTVATAGLYVKFMLPFTQGVLWAFFFLSLGSIVVQRVLFETRVFRQISYRGRFALYLVLVVLWGGSCLYVGNLFWIWGSWFAMLPALLMGIFCCVGLEIFNRRRTRMYNKLLEQYKKRRVQ